jgi:hypothetical protein
MLRIAIALVCSIATAHAGPEGKLLVDPALKPGTLALRVVYGERTDPAEAVAVTVVGYSLDGKATVARQSTDHTGQASFTKLDTSGAVAYYALALVPRGKGLDRLQTQAIVPGPSGGIRAMLAADKRGSKAPPLDAPPVTAGKVQVKLVGKVEPNLRVELRDTATGKLVAAQTAATDSVELAAPDGAVLYATTTAHQKTFRSLPFQMAAGRGVERELWIVPRPILRLKLGIIFDDPDTVPVATRLRITNLEPAPIQAIELPLPRGFTNAIFADTPPPGTFTIAGIKLARPLAPGDTDLRIGVELPIAGGKVQFAQDLPLGLFEGEVTVARAPGVTLQAPGFTVENGMHHDRPSLMIKKLSLPPAKPLALTVTAPTLSPAETTLLRACKALGREPSHALLGKPMPKTTAVLLDGKRLDLARGKARLVNFNATVNAFAHQEPASLGKLAAAVRNIDIITFFGDRDRKEVEKLVGAKPPYPVALDPSIKPDEHLGPIATAWSVPKIPETFLVDKKGIVRMYFVNFRDWGSAEALACVKALASE